MKKRDYVLLNYTGCRLYIENLPSKNTPKGGGVLYLEPIGKPRFEYKTGILPGEDFPYQILEVSGITPPLGNAIYIVMPEDAAILSSVRKDVFVPVDYYSRNICADNIRPAAKGLNCRTIARFSVECQKSWT